MVLQKLVYFLLIDSRNNVTFFFSLAVRKFKAKFESPLVAVRQMPHFWVCTWLSSIITFYPDLHFLWPFLYCTGGTLLTGLKIFNVERAVGEEGKEKWKKGKGESCANRTLFHFCNVQITLLKLKFYHNRYLINIHTINKYK